MADRHFAPDTPARRAQSGSHAWANLAAAAGLAFVASLGPVSAAPKAPPVKTFDSAKIAAEFANSVASGTYPGGIAKPPVLTADELAQIAEMKGCRPVIAKGELELHLYLHWECAGVSQAVESDLHFSTTGALADITLNPASTGFAPTKSALMVAKHPSRISTTRSFAKAVTAGLDPSLGGLIPLTPLQSKQLASLSGRKPMLVDDWTENSVVSWEDKGDFGGMTAELFFNKDRQVIGLKMVKAVIRTVVTMERL